MTTSGATASTARGLLLVANKGDRSLGIIDPAAERQLAAVPVDGVTGHEVAASPDGTLAFVPIYGNSGVGGQGTDGRLVRIISLAKRQIAHTIDYGKGVRPHCAVFGPTDGLLYITAEIENEVSIIDPHTMKILGTIPTGEAESHMLSITPDGRRGFTSNVGSGTVSVLDIPGRKLVTKIPVAERVQRIAVSIDGKRAFTADQVSNRLAVIDAEMNVVSGWIALPGKGYGMAPTTDGKWLLVALPGISKVAVIDLESLTLKHTVEVPRAPQEILIPPDSTVAFVSCDVSGEIAVVDTVNWSLTKRIRAGAGADGLAWAPAVHK